VDPIEKKPLYHWRPGSQIFSLGSLGCTMRCPFCQNYSIAQPPPGAGPRRLTELSPQTLAGETARLGLKAVAYTYNEPALQAEYILEAAPVLREKGIATVLVSNGMYSEALLRELALVVDAANIDLKSFNPKTYARLGGSLDTVRRTIPYLLEQGTHVEVTTLVVPGVSDDPEEFAAELDWLAGLSPDLPLHISRYRPAHKFTAPPTDLNLLLRFEQMAKAKLRRVHLGNVPMLRPR
jgi:pyruvate formate lyase activating enzyme